MLGENIKSFRKKKGYSQETLAQAVFVVRQTVSKWEKGQSVPDAEMLEKIAASLDVTVNELLGKEISADNEQDKNENIVNQLAILNNQLANRSRRRRKVLKTLIVAIAVVVVLTIVFVSFGIFAFNSITSTSSSVIEEMCCTFWSMSITCQ